jgi:oligoribonuclease NrnB/cAMP/cGMP phosphodiesterase (DHH superfamily)
VLEKIHFLMRLEKDFSHKKNQLILYQMFFNLENYRYFHEFTKKEANKLSVLNWLDHIKGTTRSRFCHHPVIL